MYIKKEHMNTKCENCTNDVTYIIYLKENIVYLCESCLNELNEELNLK
jgi:ribosomal protein S27E